MKSIGILLFVMLAVYACREQKDTPNVMTPVETDGGIGDGAPSLDSLLHSQKTDTLQPQLKDSL